MDNNTNDAGDSPHMELEQLAPSTPAGPGERTYSESEVRQLIGERQAGLEQERDALKACAADLSGRIETLAREKEELEKTFADRAAAFRSLKVDSGATSGGGIDIAKLSPREKIFYAISKR
jgi:hypothetical protein